MPRSGTTLLERILANHPQVAAAGELVDFARQLMWVSNTHAIFDHGFLTKISEIDWAELGTRYLAQVAWRAHGKPYLVDKQPANWMFVGMIRAALPNAKILHMVREPMDVFFSNWRTMFGDTCSWSYDFSDLWERYCDYQNLMEHWLANDRGAILDVRYSELVSETEATIRQILEFCELGWEPSCQDVTRNVLPVSTVTGVQARTPIHQQGVDRWRRYAEQMQPLMDLAMVRLGRT
jgi:hypothetical protein